MKYRRFSVNKLIRDDTFALLREKGSLVHEKTMSNEEFLLSLKAKLLEEANEVLQAKDKSELVEEFADLLEVIYTLANASDLKMEEIEEVRKEKCKSKGGYRRQIFSPYVDIKEGTPELDYFMQKPHYHEITTESASNCLFCQMAQGMKPVQFVAKYQHCFVIQDAFPVSNGHLLIIPYNHTEHWFTAKKEVREEMIMILDHMKEQLHAEYAPQGYNIGANCGSVAGQSVMHFHLHLIPRYSGDMADPKGGVRGVIPEKQKY